jgi:hypothetical protein
MHRDKNYPDFIERFLETAMPKYPRLIVTGDSITKEQALEIIRRTDSFFLSACGTGSNHAFRMQATELVHQEIYYL